PKRERQLWPWPIWRSHRPWRVDSSTSRPTNIRLSGAFAVHSSSIIYIMRMTEYGPPGSGPGFHHHRKPLLTLGCGCVRLDDDQGRAAPHCVVQMDHILRKHPHAAAGYGMTDGPLVRIAVDAIQRVGIALMDIESARAHGIVRTRLHAVA